MKFWCKIFGHKYKLANKLSKYIYELKCTRCKRRFGLHKELKTLLSMDAELRNLHNELTKK